tara:strand:- start:732 stop:938 length:207 start_codon:yes stop_codon:yes gene_type:complete
MPKHWLLGCSATLLAKVCRLLNEAIPAKAPETRNSGIKNTAISSGIGIGSVLAEVVFLGKETNLFYSH